MDTCTSVLICNLLKVTLLLGPVLGDEQLQTQVMDYNQRMSGEWRPVSTTIILGNGVMVLYVVAELFI